MGAGRPGRKWPRAPGRLPADRDKERTPWTRPVVGSRRAFSPASTHAQKYSRTHPWAVFLAGPPSREPVWWAAEGVPSDFLAGAPVRPDETAGREQTPGREPAHNASQQR